VLGSKSPSFSMFSGSSSMLLSAGRRMVELSPEWSHDIIGRRFHGIYFNIAFCIAVNNSKANCVDSDQNVSVRAYTICA